MNISQKDHPIVPDSSILNLFHSISSENFSYNSSGYVMYNLDFETGKYIFMSPAIVQLTGYSIDEINKSGFKGIVREIFSNRVERYKVFEDDNLNAEEFYAKYLIETKIGEQKWIEDNSFTYIDKNGKRLKSFGILRDTSSLQCFIDSLYDEKNNLDRIFDLSETMLLQLDARMNIVMINKKGCSILGGSKSEILGKNLAYFIPEEAKKDFKRFVDELVEEKEAVTKSTEGKINSIDNRTKYIEWHNTALRDKEGELLSVIASGQEVTRRRQEEKVRSIISEILNEANSGKKLDGLFKFIHKSIGRLMKADNFYISYYEEESGRLTFPYYVDKYGNEALPMELGKGLTSFVFNKGKSVLLNQSKIEDLIARGRADLVGEMPKIWLGVPLKIKSKVIGVIVVQDYDEHTTYNNGDQQILDVIAYTISRAIERKVVDTEREFMIEQLRETNKSKDQLFSLISHDLRNPFNSLLGFAEIITNEFDSLTRDEMMEYLNVINVSAKNLFGMTNNLLHYSRYQLGKFSYLPGAISIGELIEKTLDLQRNNIKNKKIHIINNTNNAPDFWGDEELMTIVLGNIIENAIKYSHTAQAVTISTDLSEHQNYLQVLIKDEGIGISKENMERIRRKEMFSTQGTMRESGAGLGLFLSRDFLEMNSGQLSIDSSEGEGTTVSIELPLKE